MPANAPSTKMLVGSRRWDVRAGMAVNVRWSANSQEFAMQVRPFLDSDEAAVIALWEAAGLTRSWNDPRKDIERKRSVQREWFLVGTEDDAVMASIMIGYDGHRGWINYLAVAPEHRNKGHARALMGEAERLLEAAGCPKINLQIRTSNASAIAFYK